MHVVSELEPSKWNHFLQHHCELRYSFHVCFPVGHTKGKQIYEKSLQIKCVPIFVFSMSSFCDELLSILVLNCVLPATIDSMKIQVN